MSAASSALTLTLPTDGGHSSRKVLTRALKLFGREALALPDAAFAAEVQSDIRVVRVWMNAWAHADRRGMLQLLRRPHIHMHLHCAMRALQNSALDEARIHSTNFICQLLFDAAVAGVLDRSLRWSAPCSLSSLVSPVARQVLVLHPHEGLEFRSGAVGIVATLGAPPRWVKVPMAPSDAFTPIVPGMVLSTIDHNPVSDFEAHPDKSGNEVSLGDASAEEWAASLAGALNLIGQAMPVLRAEMDVYIEQFIPVGVEVEKHLSASYRDAIGCIYLTLHRRDMVMAEALIHEFQHNKINTLSHIDPLMDNAFWPLYPSPVRPDPRPLFGVLLAAHAFVPVAEFYRILDGQKYSDARSGRFRGRWSAIIGKNDEALTVLMDHAEATPAGRTVLEEMMGWHTQHLALGIEAEA